MTQHENADTPEMRKREGEAIHSYFKSRVKGSPKKHMFGQMAPTWPAKRAGEKAFEGFMLGDRVIE